MYEALGLDGIRLSLNAFVSLDLVDDIGAVVKY